MGLFVLIVESALLVFRWRSLTEMGKGQCVTALSILAFPLAVLAIVVFWEALQAFAARAADAILSAASQDYQN